VAAKRLPLFLMNCYLIFDTDDKDQALVVDPGGEEEKILEAIEGRQVKGIVLTHNHWDHTGVLDKLWRATGATMYMHKNEAKSIETLLAKKGISCSVKASGEENEGGKLSDGATLIALSEGAKVPLAKAGLKTLHTPGHTEGSICLYDEAGAQLLTGDTLFEGAYGRTDFSTGSYWHMLKSLEQLAKLPGATKVFPGHGQPTTIEREKSRGALSGIKDSES